MKPLLKYSEDDNRKRKAVEIIKHWEKGNLPQDLDESVRQWFLAPEDKDIKTEALDAVFLNTIKENSNPDKLTYIRYRELCIRLGIPYNTFYTGNETAKKRTLRPARFMMRIAAVLIPLIVFGAAMKLWIDTTVATEVKSLGGITLVAAADSQKIIELPDGSTVWLNEGSDISISDNFADKREVEFSGEGYFSVKSDPAHPFIVKAEHITATVLGTEFNMAVPQGENESEITLVSGKLQVSTSNSKTYILSPNDKLKFDSRTGEVTLAGSAKTEPAGEWRSALEFDNVPLNSALHSIASRFNKTVEGSVGTNDRVTVSFAKEADLQTMLAILRETFMNFDYTVEGDTLSITKK